VTLADSWIGRGPAPIAVRASRPRVQLAAGVPSAYNPGQDGTEPLPSSPRAAPLFDHDLDHDEHTPKLRLCRAGFTLVAIGLALLCLSETLGVARLFIQDARLERLLLSPEGKWAWKWLVGGPITWTTLLGAYLLWAGWSEAGWRRRAGMLLLMNAVDMLQWTIRHHEDLGLPLRGGVDRHEWLFHQVTQGLGWAEFWLFADLAARLSRHVGHEIFAGRLSRARAIVAAGGLVWAFQLAVMTDWHAPIWPLHHRPVRTPPEVILLYLALPVLTIPATLNVIGLAAAARNRCAAALAAMVPDKDKGIDLLTSRSETDDFWTAPRS